MTRQFLFVAVLGLASVRAAADDRWIQFPEEENFPTALPAVLADETPAAGAMGPAELSRVRLQAVGPAELSRVRLQAMGPAELSRVRLQAVLADDTPAAGAEREARISSGAEPASDDVKFDFADALNRNQDPPPDDWLCGSRVSGTPAILSTYKDAPPAGGWGDGACHDVGCNPGHWSEGVLRFGWWGVATQGSPTKVGEFQDLQSSPFWDLDAFSSDGIRTWDLVMSGLDNEANDARMRYYGPGLTADVQFQRFLRRWDHKPLTGLDISHVDPVLGPPPGPEGNVISEDLNVGEDYAIRVQELDAKFQGRLTDNIRWRLNVWGLRKFGERQANATAHCFNVNAPGPPGATGNVCHVLSQRQAIDWLTMEIQPAVEARFENVTVEYSRTMRSFGQSDDLVERQYTRFDFSPASGALGPPFAHAIVPENFTQIDRLRVNAKLNDVNQLYASVYYGDTENRFRRMHRQFGGFDVRLVNTSIDRLTLTGYSNMHQEKNELPPFFLDEPPLAPAGIEPDSLRHPVDYNRTRAGLKGSWRPFGSSYTYGSSYGAWNGLSVVAGYEYFLMARDFATYETALGPFTQPDTKRHQVEFGPNTRWSSSLDTRLRYKVRFIEDPLIGVREASGGFNTNQPELEHEVELGGTWMPATNLMATAQVGIINRRHNSEFARFNEDDYPIITTVWYAPTPRLSLSGGYGYFSNWIDQDITLGFTLPTIPEPPVLTETTRWNYAGQNHLFSVAARYAWTPNLRVLAGLEWNRGSNVFAVPPSPAGADWSLLPLLSDVVVETQRLTAGVDWQPYDRMITYLRYVYFNFEDISARQDSGTAHMVLGGGGVVW